MPQIRPITELGNTNEISELCHAKKEPIFITKNGYGGLVVMSIETYERLIDENELDAAITDAEKDYIADNAKLYNARDALSVLQG